MLRSSNSSKLFRNSSKVDLPHNDVDQKIIDNGRSTKFDTYEELGPSLAEALRYETLPTPLKMQNLNSTDPSENIEHVKESSSSAPGKRDIPVGVTRSIIIGRMQQSSVDTLSVVEDYFTKLIAQLSIHVTGFFFLQKFHFLVYLETPPDTFARVCRSLEQLPDCFPHMINCFDSKSMRILGSCDDNPQRLLEEMSFRKGTSTRTHKPNDSTTSSDQEDRVYLQIAEAFINVVKFIRRISNVSQEERRQPTSKNANIDQALLPSESLIGWLLEQEDLMTLSEFIEIFNQPIALCLESERMWPAPTLVSH
uniref:Uncharacterized protein AlNc14C369G11085 n=1 Tax=Albugo laibachii Nc14 TaxID=890382 RepID=F0WY38_9STRA|nr:conserved hypothetical protein [Albugo laibachii Nc14]|eukprot:CCA26388.1 conserved hypothetical protein [Albugo laibachii Nc14]